MTLRERHKAGLWKKARRGFVGYPVATVAFYGPDDKVATKVSVGIIRAEAEEPFALERWFSRPTFAITTTSSKRCSSSSAHTAQSRSQWWTVSLGVRTKKGSTTLKVRRVPAVPSGRIAIVGPEKQCSEKLAN